MGSGGLTKRAAAGMALRLPPSLLAAAVRLTRPEVRRVRPVSFFERDDGSRLPLLGGYRDHGKGRWRESWWATCALFRLRRRDVLPPPAHELIDALTEAMTLPAPVREFAEQTAAVAEGFPDLVRPTGRDDARLGVPILAVVPSEEDIGHTAGIYAASARPIVAALEQLGIDLARARVLEAGCGHGYTAAAVAAAGAGEVVGVDLDVQGHSLPEEVRAVHRVLRVGRDVQLDTGDVRRLSYPDASFDAVYSIAVFEHVDDLARGLAELRRVTKPGGVGYHGVDTWFGPAGGHSLCTLDAPWGHVRLHEGEVARYMRERRPHEADEAIDFYREAFPTPRLTLDEIAAAARAVGFEVLAASYMRLPVRDPHRAWFGASVLRDCRRLHPAVGADDLLSISATLILRRR